MAAQNKEEFKRRASELQDLLVSSKEGVHELNEKVISLYRELRKRENALTNASGTTGVAELLKKKLIGRNVKSTAILTSSH